MDCSLPGSSVHGISQARILEWVVISSSRVSFQPRDQTCISCFGRQILYHWAIREAWFSKFNGILSKIIPMTYFKTWYLYIFNLSMLEYCTSVHLFISLRFYHFYHGIPRWLSGKESACQCRRYRFDPWSRKIPREGNGNPLQYSSLENLMDREPGGLQATRWMLAFVAEGLRSLLSPHAWPVTNSAPNWVHLAWFLLAVP